MLRTYTQFYAGEPVREEVYASWRTTNVQLICGGKSPTPSKILVVDCDGPEALAQWDTIVSEHDWKPRSCWQSVTGSGGLHLYFLAPPDATPCPSGLICGMWNPWGGKNREGAWIPHKEIRILGDRSLVVAPPSIHVDTGKRYVFHPDLNPRKIRKPEVIPQWILDLPRLGALRIASEARPAPRPASTQPYRSYRGYDRTEVVQAIGRGLLDQAKSWGLATDADYPNQSGWVKCYVPGREDPATSNSASESFSTESGLVQDMTNHEIIKFFDIPVRTGVFLRWQDALRFCGEKFLGKNT